MGKSLQFPGFRFKPTDVELAMYYLKKKLLGKKLDPEVIAEINIYDFSPWDLPAKSILRGDLEWYFFCSQSKKYSRGGRMNRTTENGYWKATGKDKDVKYKGRTVAMMKILVFHLGHPPKGTRTNWVMHEYRMKDVDLANRGVAQEAYVICKVFEKSGLGPQNGAQYGAPFEEEESDDDDTVTSLAVVDCNNASGSTSVINMTSTKSCQSTLTSSALVSQSEATTKTFDPFASTSGPSPITCSENEKLINVRADDDNMLTLADLVPMICNNDVQEVEDRKGKKLMVDDGIDTFKELRSMINLDDLGEDAFNIFGIDGSADDDSLDAFLPDDFLEWD